MALALAGCGRPAKVEWPAWGHAAASGEPTGAFAEYVRLGLEVGRQLPDDAQRTGFLPGQRDRAMAKLAPYLSRLQLAARQPATFASDRRSPLRPAPEQAGWRLLGRGLAWSAEDAAKRGDFDAAISWSLTGLKFGYELTGGTAMDASLGFALVAEARAAIAPHLTQMGAGQLGRLAEGVSKVWRARPPMNRVAAFEQGNYYQAGATVQSFFMRDDVDLLWTWLGKEAREPIVALERLSKRPEDEQARFFANWQAEIGQEIEAFESRAGVRASKRPPWPKEIDANRPWAELSRMLFGTLRPILAQQDAESARTQMLALHAWVLRDVKARRKAPASLSAFGRDLAADPFGEGDFVYRADAQEYMLYSVGPDLRDNGGESDPSGTTPDLVLEGQLR